MKIVKIGTFDDRGMPINWWLDVRDSGKDGYCVGLDNFGQGSVDVNGVEIVEWTEARKKAIK